MTLGTALLAAASAGWLLDLKRRLDDSVERAAVAWTAAHDEAPAAHAA
jgi:hypothetical protein